MSVGYTAGPLHHIATLDQAEDRWRPAVPGEHPKLDTLAGIGAIGAAVVAVKPMRFTSPAKAEIVAWREGLARCYAEQLGEWLTWDEESEVGASEDTATSADTMLRYVAAVLDQRGPAGLRALVGTAGPPTEVLRQVFADNDRRDLAGSFPHLLTGARCWLPYDRNFVMEAPDWLGSVQRYGSLVWLAEEIGAVRAAVADLAPDATAWGARGETPEHDVLAAAWHASDTVARLCGIALARRLPLWAAS